MSRCDYLYVKNKIVQMPPHQPDASRGTRSRRRFRGSQCPQSRNPMLGAGKVKRWSKNRKSLEVPFGTIQATRRMFSGESCNALAAAATVPPEPNTATWPGCGPPRKILSRAEFTRISELRLRSLGHVDVVTDPMVVTVSRGSEKLWNERQGRTLPDSAHRADEPRYGSGEGACRTASISSCP